MAPRRRYNRRGGRTYGRRRYNNRRGYNRKKKYNKPTTKKVNMTTGIPDRYMLKLKYSTTVDLAGNTGVTGTYVFRGNSIFDPDYSSAGGQPLGHDEWALFYREYRVNASKINVKVLNLNSTASNSTTIVTVNPSESIMNGTINAVQLPEYPYVRYKLLPAASGGNLPKTIVNYMSTKKMYGVKSTDAEEFRAGMGANPDNEWFWNINATNIQGTDTFDITMLVTITYFVELRGRMLLQIS